MKKNYPLVPFPLIVKAADGNSEAINQIIRHYRGYMTKRSLRLMKDEYGNQSMVVDDVSTLPDWRGLLFCKSIYFHMCFCRRISLYVL